MTDKTYSIRYPRRAFIRRSLTSIGKLLLTLFAEIQINGKDKLPKKGPVILAGNHASALEAALMASFTPGIVEFLGNGDIPFDPNYAFITRAYDLIPINRGNLDRKGLQMGLEVLEQDGILGIFPEGGIWDPAQMQTQIGTAWLSYRSQSPIIPIGFGGMQGGLSKALHLQRPKFTMNVGKPLPPVVVTEKDTTIKQQLQNASEKIMSEINALLPIEDLEDCHKRMDESYQLDIKVFSANTSITMPEDLKVTHGAAYAQFLFNPTMMDVLVRNLNLPIRPIKNVIRRFELEPLLNAWSAILDYLKINPGFFTYRFGMENGLAVKEALLELVELGKWVQTSGYALTLNPIRQFRNANSGALVIERGGCFPNSM